MTRVSSVEWVKSGCSEEICLTDKKMGINLQKKVFLEDWLLYSRVMKVFLCKNESCAQLIKRFLNRMTKISKIMKKLTIYFVLIFLMLFEIHTLYNLCLSLPLSLHISQSLSLSLSLSLSIYLSIYLSYLSLSLRKHCDGI